jgi:hypothetical protein
MSHTISVTNSNGTAVSYGVASGTEGTNGVVYYIRYNYKYTITASRPGYADEIYSYTVGTTDTTKTVSCTNQTSYSFKISIDKTTCSYYTVSGKTGTYKEDETFTNQSNESSTITCYGKDDTYQTNTFSVSSAGNYTASCARVRFTVNFYWDMNYTQLISTESVEYGSNATPPYAIGEEVKKDGVRYVVNNWLGGNPNGVTYNTDVWCSKYTVNTKTGTFTVKAFDDSKAALGLYTITVDMSSVKRLYEINSASANPLSVINSLDTADPNNVKITFKYTATSSLGEVHISAGISLITITYGHLG